MDRIKLLFYTTSIIGRKVRTSTYSNKSINLYLSPSKRKKTLSTPFALFKLHRYLSLKKID